MRPRRTSMTSRPIDAVPDRWAWTPTTARSSCQRPRCCNGAQRVRSPSPGRGRRTRTTAVTSSRRTGRSVRTIGRLPPLRHRRRAVVTQRDLAAAVQSWTNYFCPQQKLISKVRDGAKVSKKHDKATTPFHRAIDHANHDRGAHRGADPDLLPDQSRRHPAPGPSPDRPAPHNDHQQSWTHRPKPKLTSAHVRMRQRIRLRAHLDHRSVGRHFQQQRFRPCG